MNSVFYYIMRTDHIVFWVALSSGVHLWLHVAQVRRPVVDAVWCLCDIHLHFPNGTLVLHRCPLSPRKPWSWGEAKP